MAKKEVSEEKATKEKKKKKFKVDESLSYFACDWDGTGLKIKIRLPGGKGGKQEFLLIPGSVVATKNKKIQKALEIWESPHIYVNGEPLFSKTRLFEDTDDQEDTDLDAEEIKNG